MKHSQLLPVLGLALMSLFASCNSNETETTEDTTTVDTTVAMTAPTSTIDTTPQTIMVVWHKVADFNKWKISYDEHDSMKLAHGMRNYVIGRSVEDTNMILVAVKADDANKAKAFSKDPNLKTAMQKGGVRGTPTFILSTVVYQDQAQNMSDLRAMTRFKVKDWNTWKTSFESNRQLREDNGVTDRAYGYDVDDNKMVTLVVGITDSTKAEAFWKSDLIKQKRAESGVEGEVKRWVYRVVHRY